MKIKSVVCAAVGAIICANAMAGDDSAALQLAKKTVASKNYTDSTFQTKIPATTSGLSSYFGASGTLLATTGTDGTVQERLVLPGYSNGQSAFGQELDLALPQISGPDEFGYLIADLVQQLYVTATGELTPHNPLDSISSVGFVLDVAGYVYSKINDDKLGFSVGSDDHMPFVLVPTSEPGVVDYLYIVPGLDESRSQIGLSQASPRNWALFGGDITNNELVAMFDDISRQFGTDNGWASPGMNLNDVLNAPASLELVSDVWKESQREIPAAGYAKAATGAANAVALTSGSGSAATDWLNAAIKGTALVTKTATEGQIGERKVFEETDYTNYQAANLTANEKNIQTISIPTMGAVMAAISDNAVTLPTSTAGNVVTYDANGALGGSVATYTGAATYAPATDSAKIPTMAGVAAYVDAHGPTIPAPTGDCLNAANHCALVTTYANGVITYNWVVMAK